MDHLCKMGQCNALQLSITAGSWVLSLRNRVEPCSRNRSDVSCRNLLDPDEQLDGVPLVSGPKLQQKLCYGALTIQAELSSWGPQYALYFQAYDCVRYMTSNQMNRDLDLPKQEKMGWLPALAPLIARDTVQQARQVLSTKRLTFAHISSVSCERHPLFGPLGLLGLWPEQARLPSSFRSYRGTRRHREDV